MVCQEELTPVCRNILFDPLLELFLYSCYVSSFDSNWDSIVPMDNPVLEAGSEQAWISLEGFSIPNKTTGCTSGSVGVLSGDGLKDGWRFASLVGLLSLDHSMVEDQLSDGQPANSVQKFLLVPAPAKELGFDRYRVFIPIPIPGTDISVLVSVWVSISVSVWTCERISVSVQNDQDIGIG